MAEMHKIKIPLTSQVFSFLLANCGFFVGVCKAVIGKKITFYKKQNP
jgi:hypothetical protein